MHFKSDWITTEIFSQLTPIDVFHKELEDTDIEKSPVQNYHVHFRHRFSIDNTKNIKIRISADDYYKLYINGIFVCQGSAPGYYDYYNYNEADISKYLKKGENIIAVHVYYQGLINRAWNSADNRQGMIADIFSNEKYLFGTDETWLYSEAQEYSGDTIDGCGYDIGFKENINFNLEEKGWTNLDFDDSLYKRAVVNKKDDHIFEENSVDTIDVYTIKPEKILKLKEGQYFIDFGTEITGQFQMTVQGDKNQKVTIMCGEETQEDNPYAARYDMRCKCCYIEECVLSGHEDIFNFYDYKAFRYVNIKTDRDNLLPESFCAVVRHHKFNEKCILKTKNKYMDEIWNLCKNTLKYGVQEGFLDCPSREKGQYMGDFTVSGLAHLYLTGDAQMYKKTLFDFAKSSRVCKGLLCIAPGSLMAEIADFSLQYPLQILNYYKYTNDIETVKMLYPTVCGIIDYFKQYERVDGLLENVWDKWNLVDWPANLRDEYSMQEERGSKKIPCHNVINAFYIGALEAADHMREILGMERDYEADKKKKAYIKAFYNDKTGLFCDLEDKCHSALHSNVLALFFDIAPLESHERIRQFIVDKGLSCGVQFAYFVLKALGKIGAYEDELQLLLNESEHSWVNMLREGATTCFEAWGKDQKWNCSLCHPWACAPIIIIIEDILKIDPRTLGREKSIVEF